MMPKRNHKPERTCLGCGNRDAKRSMVRISACGGMIAPDIESRAPGRGGYLHNANECVEKFKASKVKQFRSLKIRLDRSERIRIAEEIGRLLDRATQVE